VVGVHYEDGGKSATGDEMARILELWEETEGEAAGNKHVLMRWFYQQKHLPPPHRRNRKGKKNKSRNPNKEVFEECDNIDGPYVNPVVRAILHLFFFRGFFSRERNFLLSSGEHCDPAESAVHVVQSEEPHPDRR